MHVHDALQYLLVSLFSPRKRQAEEAKLYNFLTLDKLRDSLAESDEEDYDPKRIPGGSVRW